MFINNFDPVAFQVFSFEIRWYSLAYIVGLIIGWIYCNKFLIKDQEKKNQFDDYITYIIIGIILGGRLGYVIIYNPSYYLENIIEMAPHQFQISTYQILFSIYLNLLKTDDNFVKNNYIYYEEYKI